LKTPYLVTRLHAALPDVRIEVVDAIMTCDGGV
jgi:hypothetical protein